MKIPTTVLVLLALVCWSSGLTLFIFGLNIPSASSLRWFAIPELILAVILTGMVVSRCCLRR